MKTASTVLIVVFVVASILPVFGVTKNELAKMFFLADNPESVNEVSQIALANLGIVEEILTSPMSDHNARLNAFSHLLVASQKGLITKEHFFDLAFNQIMNIQLFTQPSSVEDELKLFSSLIKHYGYKQDKSNISERFSSAYSILNSMLTSSMINNLGIKNSLDAKFRNAQNDFEKNKTGSSVNILNAAKNEINAQIEKHINKKGGLILLGYIDSIVLQIGN